MFVVWSNVQCELEAKCGENKTNSITGRLELLRYTATHHKLHFYTVLSAAARPVPRYYTNTRVLVESLAQTPQDTNII